MKKIVIIKTGDTFPNIADKYGDFEDWIISSLAVDKGLIKVVDAEKQEALPDTSDCIGAVIAGSHAMVTENLSWSLKIEDWVPRAVAAGVPLLGICYGHQLIARAMGGQVGYHPQGIEIGSVQIELAPTLSPDPLFKELPVKFYVHACHSQTVRALPPGAQTLAKNEVEPRHAFRLGKSTWGVQFHPEYDEAIMRAYIEGMASEIKKSGNNKKDLLNKVAPTPVALEIIQRFGRFIQGDKID
ncbi:MAG: glutamine amidotransferase [Desulfobacteraceae bacterium]|nr:glutamine amidotransferase [Desulfobacteraceae bacterium]